MFFVMAGLAPVSFEAPGYAVVMLSSDAVIVHFEEVAAEIADRNT